MIRPLVLACLVSLAATFGCGASQRETTLKAAVITLDTSRDAFLAYDGPHELEIAKSGPPTAEGKAAALSALAAYQSKRSAVDKAFMLAYRAVAAAWTLQDQPSLDGVQAAITQVIAAYNALKAGNP